MTGSPRHDEFGARLHAAMQARGPLCAGIDPHASLLADWGLADDVAGLESFALTAAEALAPRVAVVKPQSAFYERFGSRGIAVLERLVDHVPRGRRAGAARRQARRHRLDQPGVRRRLPRPVLAAGRGRDHRQPLPRLRLADPDDRHRARATARGVFVLALTSNKEGPEVQEARTGDAHRGRRRARPPARAQPRRRAARLLRRRRRRHHRRRRPPARHQRPDPGPRVRRPGRHAGRPAPDLRARPPATSCPAPRASCSAPGPTAWPTPPTGSTTGCASCWR